jgi:hypothetical protein
MRYELHQDPGIGQRPKTSLHRRDRSATEMIRQPVHANLFVRIDLFAWRRPHFDLIARRQQAVGDLLRVVGYSAWLRRIFAGNDVPSQSGLKPFRLRPL